MIYVLLSLCFCSQLAGTINRSFGLRYNPYTQSVEVLSTPEKIASLVSELRGDLCIVSDALKRINEQENNSADENATEEAVKKLLKQLSADDKKAKSMQLK